MTKSLLIMSALLTAGSFAYAHGDGAAKLPQCQSIVPQCEKAGFEPGMHKKDGKGLWAEPDRFTTPASECRGEVGMEKPSAACDKFLEANQKAAAQYELERRFRVFESNF